MNKLLTTAVAATFIAGASIAATSFESKSKQIDAESLLACHWFPVCKDPDFHQSSEMDSLPQAQEKLDLDLLYACHWFPVCKDPDQPVHVELGSEAIA